VFCNKGTVFGKSCVYLHTKIRISRLEAVITVFNDLKRKIKKIGSKRRMEG
jgi:hypothetical protein